MNFYTLGFVILETILVVATKYFFSLGIHPYFFVLFTGLSASIILLIYLIVSNQIDKSFIKWSVIKTSLATGVFASLANLIGFLGLKMTSVTNYAFLNRTNLLIIPILSWIILKEKIKPIIFPLAGLALIGVLLLTGDWRLMVNISGDSLALLAAVAVSLDFIYQKKAVTKTFKDEVAFWRRLISAFLVGSIWLFTPELGQAMWQYWPWMILFSFGFAMISVFLVRAVASQPVAEFSLFSSIGPLLVALTAFFALNEKLNQYQIAGGALIFGSIFIFNLIKKQESLKLKGKV
ncbi:DMT family transporter [Patescibacteria group bacterium]